MGVTVCDPLSEGAEAWAILSIDAAWAAVATCRRCPCHLSEFELAALLRLGVRRFSVRRGAAVVDCSAYSGAAAGGGVAGLSHTSTEPVDMSSTLFTRAVRLSNRAGSSSCLALSATRAQRGDSLSRLKSDVP